MKVKDVMIRDVKSILPDTSVNQAWELLKENEISGLPVLDQDSKLVGMFTEKDILVHILPSYIEKVGKFVYEQNPKATKRKFKELSQVTVKQFMRKEVVTISEDTTLCEVARVMLTQKVRRIPVLDNSGKVVGIVARCDVLKAIAEE